MTFLPQYRFFCRRAIAGGRFPFLLEVKNPLPPRESFARLRFLAHQKPLLLLESSRDQGNNGRWSWILSDPVMRLRAKGARMAVSTTHQGTPWRTGDALSCLKASARACRMPRLAGYPPFLGGAAGLAAYEWKNQIHFGGRPRAKDPFRIPDLDLGFYDRGWVYDHRSARAWVFVAARTDRVDRKAFDRGVREAVRWREVCRRRLRARKSGKKIFYVPDKGAAKAEVFPTEAKLLRDKVKRGRFCARVLRAKELIRDGWIYQANLSHAIEVSWKGDPWTLYPVQAVVNPSCFGGFADFGTHQLVCGSPERLVARRGDRVFTRPIAGTRPKAASRSADRKFRKELLLSEKERAEHVMLVDLERNDLGRVCRAGSVRVNEFMTVEEYSHVRHIVSNVEGRIAPDQTSWDLLASLFPGGTITGAPKISAMKVIEKLEGKTRGAYTGALGYTAWSGDCDWNIVIRSALIQGNRLILQVGAGIVADSDPDREYEETIHKAGAFLKTLHMASQGGG